MKSSTPRRQCTVRIKPIIIRLSALLLQLSMNIIITLPVITIIIVVINTVISLMSSFTATQQSNPNHSQLRMRSNYYLHALSTPSCSDNDLEIPAFSRLFLHRYCVVVLAITASSISILCITSGNIQHIQSPSDHLFLSVLYLTTLSGAQTIHSRMTR